MSFTFYTRKLDSDEVNPYATMMQKALHNYTQQQNAKYLPQKIQADILGKTLGPLAELGTSTKGQIFAGPQGEQARQMLSQILAQYAQSQHPQQSQGFMDQISNLFRPRAPDQQQMNGQQPQGQMPGQAPEQQQPMSDGQQQPQVSPEQIAATARQRAIDPMTANQVPGGTPYGVEGNQKISPSANLSQQTENAVVGGKNTADLVSGLLGEVKNLKNDKSWTSWFQKNALGAEATGIPYVSGIGSAIAPRNLVNFQNKLADSLIKYHNFSSETADKIVHKGVNESLNKYSERIKQELIDLQKREKNLTKTTGSGGVSLEGNKNYVPSNSEPSGATAIYVDPVTKKEWPVHTSQIEAAKKAGLVEANRA